jgi:hypothetical protein
LEFYRNVELISEEPEPPLGEELPADLGLEGELGAEQTQQEGMTT